MKRRSSGYVAGVILVTGLLVAACASNDSMKSTIGPAEVVSGDSGPSTTSHMMGMSTGPDPEPAAVDASPYVFGILPNVTLPLDSGVAREVAVIAQGEPVPGTNAVPVVVRNMTRDTVHMVQAHVDLLDANDQVVDSGSFVFLAPFVVAPGEIAFGAVPTNPDWDTTSGTLRAKVDSFNVMSPGPEARSMAVVTEAFVGDGAITGSATNDTDTAFGNGVEVTVMCFDTIRRPFHVATVEVPGEIPSGESVEFDMPLEGDAAKCNQVLLAATELD